MLVNHSHFSLLEHYLQHTSPVDWVMATIVNKEGSSYRSSGAIMLFNSIGQSFGLVSGGCLEANLMLHAKKVLVNRQSQYVVYDMRDEDSYAADLGVGCKGKIGVLLQYISPKHNALFDICYQRMMQGKDSLIVQAYMIDISDDVSNALALYSDTGELLTHTFERDGQLLTPRLLSMPTETSSVSSIQHNITAHGYQVSITRFCAPINFWVFGGGADAQPLVMLANQLGWRVTVVDHRSSYARASIFHQAAAIYHTHPDDHQTLHGFERINAAMIMTHNLSLDAAWLKHLYQVDSIQYIGLLGPKARRQQVESIADISDLQWLKECVNGPAGLNLGGELPESIALSIIAQCHSVIYQGDGCALSGII